ncbi:hypothetical protein FYU45_15630 [Salmonella enterica subsp. diarizonae]|nr:hypothetical protein [Salmonella enterica subsp. diarizonae]ECQ1025684.1 hypothetical protein [Salmonella enterica subsp. diarizonae]EDE1923929.1 hypothetical protein [Salmonella enterica subsp. diarizonae]
MKLTVGDIRFFASGYASATVGVETGIFPFLLFSICKMDVSVPVVDGKEIKDYDEDLKNKAREIITNMYKEIVCDGEPGEAGVLLDYLGGKIEPSELGKELLEQIKSTCSNNELEERVATLEKRLGGERNMRITSEHGQLLVHGERVSAPTYDHRNVIINKAIDELKSGHINMLKRLGRCMGLLQVAAEIEAVNQLCGSACRENVLKDFDNPPFKNVPDDWISPGVKYLKRRLNKEAHTPGVNQESDGSLVVRKADASVALRMAN